MAESQITRDRTRAILVAICLLVCPLTVRAQGSSPSWQRRTGSIDLVCSAFVQRYGTTSARHCVLTDTVIPGFRLLEVSGTATDDGYVALIDTRDANALELVAVLESFESPEARYRRTWFALERVERSHVGARTLLSLTTTRGVVDFDPASATEHEDKRARVTLCIAEDDALRTLRCDVRFGVRRVQSIFAVTVPASDTAHENWPYPRGVRRSRSELGAMYTILSTGRVLLRRESEAWPDEDDGFGDAPIVMRSLF